MLRPFLSLLIVACSARAACIGVEGREITAADLAKADHSFFKLDPATVFSYAPAPGAQRLISGDEIGRWAARQGLREIQVSDICFERTSRTIDRDQIARAISAVVGAGYNDLRIDVVDVCRCETPPGRLEFTLDGATAPPDTHPETPVLWRGRIISNDGGSFPIWARVRVLASLNVVRAAATLHAHQILSKQDLQVDNVTASPLAFHQAQSIARYVGQIMNVTLTRGSILTPALVHAPSDVERGSLVAVSVVSGGALLALQVRADTSGNIGQEITVRNPMGSGKFQATVTGPGRAEIVVAPIHSMEPRVGSLARQSEAVTTGGGL